jgi:hypothetical protein
MQRALAFFVFRAVQAMSGCSHVIMPELPPLGVPRVPVPVRVRACACVCAH